MARACSARCNTDSTNLYPRHHRRSERDARRRCTERVALAAFDAAAAPWREALEDLDEDVLAEAAAEARAFGAGPAAAVGELVRGLLGQLADWQQSS